MQSHVRAIDRNIETTNIWLNELSNELHAEDKEEAWNCLNAVLRTIRDRLPAEDAVHFAAQLPTLIRGSYYEGWRPSEAPHKWRHKEDYLAAVRDRMPGRDKMDIEEAVRAVLRVAGHHMNEEEIRKIKSIHPKDVWDLWPV